MRVGSSLLIHPNDAESMPRKGLYADLVEFSKYETPDITKDPYYIKSAQTEEPYYIVSEIKDAPKYFSFSPSYEANK